MYKPIATATTSSDLDCVTFRRRVKDSESTALGSGRQVIRLRPIVQNR
jgi:hypothetical protein